MAFGDRVTAQDFTLTAANNNARGLWSDGVTIWVTQFDIHNVGGDPIFAYNLATKAYESGKNFTLDADNSNPIGIWSDGITMWVSDQDDTIYAYNLITKAYESGKNFTTLTAAGNIDPEGIWSDGTTMWVTDIADKKLYAYNLITKAYESDKDIPLEATHARAVGLWSDGVTIWVANFDTFGGGFRGIYAYNLITKAYESDKDILTVGEGTGAGGLRPAGLWSDGVTIWVATLSVVQPFVDAYTVFAYDITAPPPPPPLAPNTPTSLDVSPVFNTLDISWIAPAASPVFGPATSYDLRHRVRSAPPAAALPWTTRTGITQTFTNITNLLYSTIYEVQVRAVNVTGESAWSGLASAATPAAQVPAPAAAGAFHQFTLRIDRAGDFLDEFGNILTFSARWGRSEASFLARVLPLQMQVTLENESGRYDPTTILPRARIHLDHMGVEIAHGYVASVRPQLDHATGFHTTIIHAEGALALFNKDAYELSLFVTDTVRTGQVVHDALNQTGWPPAQRDIDAGQVRLQPAHYTELLAPRVLGRLGPVLRTTEEAELGLLHERRGDFIIFEERFHRELSSAQPVFGFGSQGLRIRPIGVVNPEDSWDNIYTVIRVAISRASVQTDKRVYTWRKDTIGDNPLQIPGGATRDFVIDMTREPRNLEDDNVASVVQWTTAVAEFETPVGAPVSNAVVTYTERTRTRTKVTCVNPNPFPINLTKLELSARGVALYGDFTIPDLSDAASVALYDQRFLDLPTNVFIGDGTDEDVAIPEGQAVARLLLTRYNHPQPHGRIPFDPLENALNISAMGQLNVSVPVLVEDSVGMPAGTYYVEGGDITLDPARDWATMGVNLSKRGSGSFFVDNAVNITPQGTAWVNVAPTATLVANVPYVIAAEVTFPTGTIPSQSDDPVMRLVLDGEQQTTWTEQDIPINDAQFRASLRLGPGIAIMQVRRRTASSAQLTASRFRVFRVES